LQLQLEALIIFTFHTSPPSAESQKCRISVALTTKSPPGFGAGRAKRSNWTVS
jgi:hypothetical protein